MRLNNRFCRAFALAALLSAAAAPAFAAVSDSVIVLAKDGSTFTALIADTKSIALGADKVTVTTGSGTTADFSYADIDKIYIGTDPAGISDLTSDGNIAIWPRVTSSALNIAGAEAGTPVDVYTIGGVLVAKAEIAGEGTTTIDLSAASAGVCLVRIGDNTVKVIKQ